MLTLNPDEETWLEAYKKALDEQFPGLIEDIIIYGSKARGDAHEDSDLDVLIIIHDGTWKLKDEISFTGYDLSIGLDIIPSIQIYTHKEWNRLKEDESIFQEAVVKEGISVR